MSLSHFKVSNFRNISTADIRPSNNLNLIHGSNGSGKTSLLESIYYLSRVSSFKTTRPLQLIKRGEERFTLFGEISTDEGTIPIGLQRSSSELQMRVAGNNANSISEVASQIPLLIINPDSHELLEQGPTQRRQFIDWGVFHVEHSFYPIWSRYKRALKQRNAALRSGDSKSASVWNSELVSCANEIDRQRINYIDRLKPLLPEFAAPLVGSETLELSYQPGWDKSEAYSEQLERSLVRDSELGHTRYGPHRADLIIKMGGQRVQTHISRGQQKLLVCALRMAQVQLLAESTDKRSLLLIDDLPAELDRYHRDELMKRLANLPAQLFISAIEPELLNSSYWESYSVFHVEHGSVEEVV
ncbi:hypothetical protein BOW53_09045 [Solemya pervernicosa gill symbiont]|uniref:DNA replication and repair protein RecF n=2 Tax=Gammaproteobacteria incertae sedis TaxID=118884 RepID=A0A1T2L4V3_9GAMM|nr:DNA replication/repair protein RecF [Candidatus Reidiella endopervernicosa]OOZ40091.1 hypothetical protein BOW53_09045 [Solemya pervernicosa gill symbiont]QKQ25405.1 DNA replication/repair protein RecF [Candidatus Reidiella endopervernicosa]